MSGGRALGTGKADGGGFDVGAIITADGFGGGCDRGAYERCALGVESHGGAESGPLAFGLFQDHPEQRDGHLHFGEKSGFGLDPDWKFVERYRVE